MTLAELKPGDTFCVRGVDVGGEIGKRLVEMGFCPGTIGKVIRAAPLGDPIQVSILRYNISLRKDEANGIAVERIR